MTDDTRTSRNKHMDYSSENPIYPPLTTYDMVEIAAIQRKLNAIRTYLHYPWNLVPVSGLPGDETIEALKAFQRFQYMTPTGKIDTYTKEKIDDVYRWSQRAAQVNNYGSYDYQETLRPPLASRSLADEHDDPRHLEFTMKEPPRSKDEDTSAREEEELLMSLLFEEDNEPADMFSLFED